MKSHFKKLKDAATGKIKPCDSDLCKAFNEYIVPDSGRDQGHLEDYLQSYLDRVGNLNPERQTYIGTLSSLRRRRRCCLCQFLLKRMSEDDAFPNADELADCAANVQRAFFLNPTFQTMDGMRRGPLSTLSEKVMMVAESTDRNPKLGRAIDPSAGVFDRARAWLNQCESQHADICPVSRHAGFENDDRPQSLRVIDVLDNRIANISWNEKYAALSYIWGSSEPPKLYRAELARLSAPGSLLSLRKPMPQTILDAMILVKKLGLRYFWFDSLCLIQDDPDDLRRGIRNMDAIYEAAWFTIIAAQGPSAESGLPGVCSFPRSLAQDFTKVKSGLTLLRVHSLDEHLNQSAYATRGWTLQEQYLSRRTIVFVHGQAYFRCRRSLWSEETCADMDSKERDDLAWGTNLVYLEQESLTLDDDPERFSRYLKACIGRFQLRNLTFDDDAISAMTGILRRISAMAKTPMWQGVPEAWLPAFMLFTLGKLRRRPLFPSWTWAGWAGQPAWEDELGVCGLVFSEVDHTGATREIWRPGMGADEHMARLVGSGRLHSSQQRAPWTLRPYPLLKFRTLMIYLSWEVTAMFDAEYQRDYAPQIILMSEQRSFAGVLFSDDRNMGEPSKGSLQLAVLATAVQKPPFSDFFLGRHPDIGEMLEGPLAWLMYLTKVDGLWERRGLGIVREACLTSSSTTVPEYQTILLA